jgi:uncharacterized protein (UPF0548 family)
LECGGQIRAGILLLGEIRRLNSFLPSLQDEIARIFPKKRPKKPNWTTLYSQRILHLKTNESPTAKSNGHQQSSTSVKLRPCIAGPAITFQEAKGFAPNFSDARSLPERTRSVALGVGGNISDWQTDFLFDYDVFPPYIMRHEAEWVAAGRRMQVGDIILQRAVLPPIGFGICMEFAVRICSVIHEENRLGFGYETLSGHAERGVSEFFFEDHGDSLAFTIHTFSEPGHWTSRLAKRVITLPYQAWCTRQALKHVRKRFWLENAGRD